MDDFMAGLKTLSFPSSYQNLKPPIAPSSPVLIHRTNYLRSRAQYKYSRGDFKGTIEDADAILAMVPCSKTMSYGDPRLRHEFITYSVDLALSMRGFSKLWLNDYSGAIADFDSTLEITASDPGTLSYRGMAKMLQGNYAGALEDFNASLKISPGDRDSLALFCRGCLKSALKDFEGGMADFDKQLVGSISHIVLKFRGEAKRIKGDLKGALADFNAVLAKYPRDPWFIAQRELVISSLEGKGPAAAGAGVAAATDPKPPAAAGAGALPTAAATPPSVASPGLFSKPKTDNWTIVRIWIPRDSKGNFVTAHEAASGAGNVGHATLQTSTTYASFWPLWRLGDKGGPVMAMLGEAEGDLIEDPSIDEDRESKLPDVQVVLYSLNVDAINKAFISFSKSPEAKKWSLFGKNRFNVFNGGAGQSCSGLVYDLLNAGGIESIVKWDIVSKTWVIAPDAIARVAVMAAATPEEIKLANRFPLPPGIKSVIKKPDHSLDPHTWGIGSWLSGPSLT